MSDALIDRCLECEERMQMYDTPVEHGFSVFGCDFILRRWTKKPFCTECETERQRRGVDMACEQAYSCGFNDGLETGKDEL